MTQQDLAEEELTPKERRYREQRALRMDHVLGRVFNSGLASLNAGELAFLDRTSAELRYELGIDEQPPRFED